MSTKLKFVDNQMYEYEKYELVDQYDPFLRVQMVPYIFNGDESIKRARKIAVSLLETMKEYNGVGLAANQVGLACRVFVVGSDGVGYSFFNPEIISTEGTEKFEEGCLTFPGLFLPITRPARVTVKYQDMNGVSKEEIFSGLTARTILHEYDHLEGIVFTSKVSPITLDRCKSKVKINLKKLKRQEEMITKRKIIAQAVQKLAPNKSKENQVLIMDTDNSLK